MTGRSDYGPDGKLKAFWDFETRKYTEYDEAGAPIPESIRDFDDTENAIADAAEAEEVVAENKSSNESNLAADLAYLQGQIAKTNAVLNAEFTNNPAAMLKPIMRTIRRLTKAALNDYRTPD